MLIELFYIFLFLISQHRIIDIYTPICQPAIGGTEVFTPAVTQIYLCIQDCFPVMRRNRNNRRAPLIGNNTLSGFQNTVEITHPITADHKNVIGNRICHT